MGEPSLDYNFISMKNKVHFLDVKDQYNYGKDLVCQFKYDDYTPGEGDRIAIFKVGWSTIKDYIVFEWVPLNVKSPENIYTVVFSKHILLNIKLEDVDLYQICYLGGESEIYGVSSPFQFTNQDCKVMGMISSFACLSGSIYHSQCKENSISSQQEEKNHEMEQLKQENQMLKGKNRMLEEEVDMLKKALKAAQAQVPVCKNYDRDILSLRQVTDDLKKMQDLGQSEISELKKKITEIKEEYIKLHVEKYKVEKKYETLKAANKKEKVKSNNCNEFDISDLTSIPPFPISRNPLK